MSRLFRLLLGTLGCFLFVIVMASAEETASTSETVEQHLITLPVKFVNQEGRPVGDVEVSPWALRSSQGHGQWNDERTGYPVPEQVKSDANGMVEVQYPFYANPKEHVLTTQVTLSVDHPEYVFKSHQNINVPYEEDEPFLVELEKGVTVEIEPIENGKPTDLKALHCLWSDGRSWLSGASPTVTQQGTLRIPPLSEGKSQVLLVRLDGEHATHFSPIDTVEGKAGEVVKHRLELLPAVRITGRLSDNVPRPIHNGRVCVSTLPEKHHLHSVDWWSWSPIAEDGKFVIERWPATQPIQVTALCDHYIARSGDTPSGIEPRDPDPYWRPQTFQPSQFSEELLIEMQPMVR
ncbi:hypothetical protein [Bythopirellula goksoeyrii]|uniref:Nickel uptake substrate-specific transmembrane region n=1 Tax=Bythopirellula goksoeyrii TaxID=1400387 RepID=A0A5B9QV42_9BACT|nr:hypothetical protein [Bythopirellula goksoeyrii]QEG37803.1 hypothetical protein Pr1d_51500 [Bythopirellula goksoeyrii]